MSKVRTSGKTRKTKAETTTAINAMMDDDRNEAIVQALSTTLSMFDGNAMSDDATKPTKQSKSTTTSMDDSTTMGDQTTGKKKTKKDKAAEDVIAAPAASAITALLPQKIKVDRTVAYQTKEGDNLMKPRSKKERLKDKQKALIDHIAAKNEAVELHTKSIKKSKKSGAIFNFGDDFSRALDDATAIGAGGDGKAKANAFTSILTGAGQFKKDKKTTKALQEDRTKFENVMQHPAFQSNPIGALQQHLTNQMALMRQVDEQQNGTAKKVENKIKKGQQGSQAKYDKLVGNKQTLASSMRK